MYIGVDMGGTKIEAIALTEDGQEIARKRVASPRHAYEKTLAVVHDLACETAKEAGASPEAEIGIGIPGSLSPATGLVRNANSTWLNGRPLARDLEKQFGRPVHIENDANCFALSEAADGAGKGYHSVFGIILGTGVGGGLVLNGRLIGGANRIAGEWGHNSLPWPRADETPGPACYCGKRGCIETFLSGPALESEFQRLTGKALKAPEIAAEAQAGNGPATALLELYADRLARALASVINIFDPEIIVFGGGLSNIEAVIAGARERLPQWVFSDCLSTVLTRNHFGDSSGVRGAARLPLYGRSIIRLTPPPHAGEGNKASI